MLETRLNAWKMPLTETGIKKNNKKKQLEAKIPTETDLYQVNEQ